MADSNGSGSWRHSVNTGEVRNFNTEVVHYGLITEGKTKREGGRVRNRSARGFHRRNARRKMASRERSV